MSSNKFLTKIFLTSAWAGIILLSGVSVHLPVQILLIGSLTWILLDQMRRALIWSVAGALVYETFMPYPSGTLLIALLLTLGVMYLCTRSFLTNRTLTGAAATALMGSLLFELLLTGVAWSGVHLAPGWAPALDRSHLVFMATRIGVNTLALALTFLLIQRFSPHTRGVIIRY